jgi:hypothetical protein
VNTTRKIKFIEKLLCFALLLSTVSFVSCKQEASSGGNGMSAEDRSQMDALKDEVKKLRDANKELAAKIEQQSSDIGKQSAVLEKQGTALETIKLGEEDQSGRIAKVEYQAIWQSNSVNNVIQYFSDRLAAQQTAISNVTWQVILLNLKSQDNEAVFDAANSTGFSRINTDSGFFLVALKNVEPYLDGYRISLDVGNPLSATYKNLKFNVSWGKKYDSKESANDPNAYQKWLSALHTKEISVVDDLAAGTWNKVQLVLSPAKSDELGYISIKLTTDTASLRRPLQAQP